MDACNYEYQNIICLIVRRRQELCNWLIDENGKWKRRSKGKDRASHIRCNTRFQSGIKLIPPIVLSARDQIRVKINLRCFVRKKGDIWECSE